jgi:hypothetical protein
MQGIVHAHILGQHGHHHDARQQHAAHHHGHLLFLRLGHGPCASAHSIYDDQRPDEDVGERQVPVQECAQYDGRCIDRDAGRQSALHEEKQCGERAGAQVETLFQKFIGCEHLEPVEYRDERDREDDHGHWQTKVELHEAHAVRIRLSRSAQKGDGAGLRGHDADADAPPLRIVVALEVAIQVATATGLPCAISNNEDQRAEQHCPIKGTHAKCCVSRWNRPMSAANTAMSSAYHPFQVRNTGGFSSEGMPRK